MQQIDRFYHKYEHLYVIKSGIFRSKGGQWEQEGKAVFLAQKWLLTTGEPRQLWVQMVIYYHLLLFHDNNY